MFKLVGWVVMTSFALYGLAKFAKEHVVFRHYDEPPTEI